MIGPRRQRQVESRSGSHPPSQRGTRRTSMAVQRSMTTARPPAAAIRAASQLTTPSWSHSARAPDRDGLRGDSAHASGRRKTSTMSNGPDAVDRLGERPERRDAQHLASRSGSPARTRSPADEVLEHAERRPRPLRRRADHGDPTRRSGAAPRSRRRRAAGPARGPPGGRGSPRGASPARSAVIARAAYPSAWPPRARTAGRRRPAGCCGRRARPARRSSRCTAARRRTAPGSPSGRRPADPPAART